MPMSSSSSETRPDKDSLRERVLDAAERVVSRAGAAHLTLNAVVAEAQVSKGGMLYHFPSKEALLQGLLTRRISRHMARVEKLRAEMPPDTAHALGHAHLRACIEKQPVGRDLGLAVIAAGVHNPDLLTPGCANLAETAQVIRDMEDEVPTARLLWLAMHGMHFLDILGISPLSDEDKAALRDQARRILDSTGETR